MRRPAKGMKFHLRNFGFVNMELDGRRSCRWPYLKFKNLEQITHLLPDNILDSIIINILVQEHPEDKSPEAALNYLSGD